jgi:hypothetical protein
MKMTEMKVQRLLETARDVVLTPEEKEQQRRSFAYGNVSIENPRITREMVDREADLLDGKAQGQGLLRSAQDRLLISLGMTCVGWPGHVSHLSQRTRQGWQARGTGSEGQEVKIPQRCHPRTFLNRGLLPSGRKTGRRERVATGRVHWPCIPPSEFEMLFEAQPGFRFLVSNHDHRAVDRRGPIPEYS